MSAYPNIDPDFITYLNRCRNKQDLPLLNSHELVCLSGALSPDKQTYKTLAEKYSLNMATLKQRGSDFWKWMDEIFPDQHITKSRLAHLYPELLAFAQQSLADGDKAFSRVQPRNIVGLVPSTASGFYGRTDELAKFHAALRVNRFVNVFGIVGIGKRTFVAHYLKDFSKSLDFEKFVWVHNDFASSIFCAVEALGQSKSFIVIEYAESLKENDGLNHLKRSLPQDYKVVLVSSSPLRRSWILEFPLASLSLESAGQILAEFDINLKKEAWWRSVIESLGGNPAFIRQYAEWATNVLGTEHKELIARGTVQYGVIEPLLTEILEGYSAEEIALLKFLSQSDKPVDLVTILRSYPAFAARLQRLCRGGLIEQRRQNEKKSVYWVPEVLKKYILLGK